MQSKILLTGGHLTPALAVIEELQKQRLFGEIIFVGRRRAMEGDKEPSEEYRVITSRRIRFLSLTSGRWPRSFTWRTPGSLLKVPLGFIQAFYYTIRERPKVIVSFGGYLALPVVVAGWILRIPVITHEQARVPGLTNLKISHLARMVCLTYPETQKYFPQAKTIVTGLPLRSVIFDPPKKYQRIVDDQPLIYITGGVTGALTLNRLIFPALGRLLEKYVVVHQTGRKSLCQAEDVRNKLPQELRKHYYVFPYLDGPQHSWILNKSILVIGRSGANTVGELAALGKVAILIPLPWAASQEQLANARWLEKEGTALILEQRDLSPDKLLAAVKAVQENLPEYERSAKNLSQRFPRDGATKMVEEIKKLCL